MSKRTTIFLSLLLTASLAAGLFLMMSGRPAAPGFPLFSPEQERPASGDGAAPSGDMSPPASVSAGDSAPSAPSEETASSEPPDESLPAAQAGGLNEDGALASDLRGVWVSTVYNLDYPSKPGLPADTLRQEALRILDGAADIGLNAVFLQVRPTGDALYPSEIFPWSDYLTAKQGQAPESGFDPLAFWVEEAHKRGLELHAWINPFRITKGSTSAPKQDVNALAESNPARKNPSWTIKYTDGCLYFNPGLPEVRRMVVNGVSEILRRYDVDGIHYDDYFYPGPDFDDNKTYQTYGKGFIKKDDWRRDCVNQLIQDTYAAVKELRPSCSFGVSPAGIWANKSSSVYGSDTNGQETYSAHCADAYKWIKSEWLDYICPQIYWNIGYDKADYKTLLNWWASVTSGTSVDLYIGQAAYRTGTGTKATDPWYGVDEIPRQLALNAAEPEVRGSVFFRYGSFADSPALYAAVKSVYNPAGGTASAVMPVDGVGTLTVGRPGGDVSTTASSWYILGASDPGKPLLLNGTPVEGRGEKGFFGVYVTLKAGKNVFTFTQGGTTVTRTITRKTASTAQPDKMSKAEIPADSVFPQKADEYARPGEQVTLKCTAPIGAKVTVTLGGKTYTMTPAAKTAPSGGYYATTYSYTYTIPAQTVTGKIVQIGKPEYAMTMGGQQSRRTARAIQCVTDGAPYYAEVTVNWAYVFPGATTTGGPSGELCKGQKDYITGVTRDGAWVRLGMGVWIQSADVKRSSGGGALNNQIGAAVYERSDKWDALTLTVSQFSATRVDYDGAALKLTVYNAASAPKAALPDGAPFASADAALSGGKAVYTLRLKAGQRLDGYYVSVSNGKLTLNIKKTIKVKPGDKPLAGITILLDPGHGGSEPGALGPLGMLLPEKTINLYAARKLQAHLTALGATVVMTRNADIDLSLAQRVEKSRTLRPDLFLSVHANSLDESKDAAAVRGLSTWYREKVSADFAGFLYDFVKNDLSLSKRGATQSNLYVARPAWTPSVILETGFLCNPQDAEWLADNDAQEKLAGSVARGIVAYFSR